MKQWLMVAWALVLVGTGYAQLPPPGAPVTEPAKVPSKWFSDAKGFQKALEAQKETGADIFLYFARLVPDDQKGLCSWWEKKGLKTPQIGRLLKDYVKVQITLPSNEKDEALAQQFNVRHCPSIVIIQPNGWKNFCKVFDWPQNRPELKSADDLEELFRANSSERYRTGD